MRSCSPYNQRPANSKIFNPNPTRKNFFKPKPDPNPKKFFFKHKPDPNPKKIFFSTRNLKNCYFTILALKIFKTAFNIQIPISYKDHFCQVFGINQILDQASFNIFPKKSWCLNPNPTRTKRLKPENRSEPEKNWFSNPNPTRFRVWVGSGFFRFRYPMQLSAYDVIDSLWDSKKKKPKPKPKPKARHAWWTRGFLFRIY